MKYTEVRPKPTPVSRGCMWLIVIACLFLLTLSCNAQVGTMRIDEALMDVDIDTLPVLIGNAAPTKYLDVNEGKMLGRQWEYLHEPEYDSSQYIRVSEYQALKQQLNDKREVYRREIALHVTVRFSSFMSPEKAAREGVRYADALINELEKQD